MITPICLCALQLPSEPGGIHPAYPASGVADDGLLVGLEDGVGLLDVLAVGLPDGDRLGAGVGR